MRILICDDEVKYLKDLKIHIEEYIFMSLLLLLMLVFVPSGLAYATTQKEL